MRSIPATIKRKIHWEIECDSADIFEKIKKSGVLFNDRKEFHDAHHQKGFLVRAKEDMLGQQKQQMLVNHFEINGVSAIRHSVLLQIAANEETTQRVLDTLILFNPYAHDCYYY